MFIVINVNFHLKHKKVLTDVCLNKGYTYFVDEKDYKMHLAKFDTLIHEDQSTCNNHNTVKSENLKKSTGTAASSVITVECT